MDIMLNLPRIISAVGGLGVAAFGFVDATKAVYGGVNHIGFRGIRQKIEQMLGSGGTASPGLADALETLRQNWFNGTDLVSQKAIAKSMVKLNLDPGTAGRLAAVTKVKQDDLKVVAAAVANGEPMKSEQSNTYARFDLALTAILDATYQRADQQYRNATRGLAMVVAAVLAVGGMGVIDGVAPWALTPHDLWQAVIVGLLATPLAPISKDLSTALATTVDALQLVGK